MSDCSCRSCGYEGSEDDFFREDVHDLVDVLQESFEDGLISSESFNNMMDVFNTEICPSCGEKETMVRFDEVDVLYEHGMIDADKWWERKHG